MSRTSRALYLSRKNRNLKPVEIGVLRPLLRGSFSRWLEMGTDLGEWRILPMSGSRNGTAKDAEKDRCYRGNEGFNTFLTP
jgi:hypothetical protein